MTALVVQGDARCLPLPDASVDLIVTSPPYFALRSYTDAGTHYQGQIGSEATPTEYLDALWACTREWMRVLKPEGSIFVNLGDKYSTAGTRQGNGDGLGEYGTARTEQARHYGRKPEGMPSKSLMGIPWRYAIGCIDQLGLILRAEIIWAKPNGLPESVTDRVRRSHETWFHFTKQPRYYSAIDEIRETTPFKPPRPKSVRAGPLIGSHATTGYDGNGMRMDQDYNNPLGKLPSSVWSIEYELWDLVLSGQMRFCPRCGRDLIAGISPDLSTETVTDSNGSPTSDIGEPIGSLTNFGSDPSQQDSLSTTFAETKPVADQITLSPSPLGPMFSEATHQPHETRPKPPASMDTHSHLRTLTSELVATESADCVCATAPGFNAPPSVWSVPSEPLRLPKSLGIDHFAAFPTELPRRLILGWSPPGICTACGQGRRPVSTKQAHGEKLKRNLRHIPGYDHPNGEGQRDVRYEITGYMCACGQFDVAGASHNRPCVPPRASDRERGSAPVPATRPALILDPFGGTGTVALVAHALGRVGITVDMSGDYSRLARWRTTDRGELAKAMRVEKPKPVPDGQMEMFA